MPTVPLRRSDLLADQREHPPFGHRAFAPEDPPVRVGITGSGADMLLLAWSATDLAREVEAGTRVLGRLGVRAGARVANTLPGALATPGALLLGDVNEAIGALDVPLGTVEGDVAARAAWELMERVRCDICVLDPRTAPTFFGAVTATQHPWWHGIVWLRGAETTPLPLAPVGFGGWQRIWLAAPEVTSFAGGTCEHGRLHLDDGVEADVADGELVLRARARTMAAGPFGTGVRVQPGRCTCGWDAPALEL